MIAPKIWTNPESQVPESGLGFGFKRLVDPRRHLRRLKKLADPREHLKFAKRTADPLGMFRRRRGKRGKLTGRALENLRAKHPELYARILAKRQASRQRRMGALPPRVTMAVQSDEARAALGDLGIKLHIGRKLRKKIGIIAGAAALTYFGGGALVSKFGAKGVAKGAGGAALKMGKKKLSAKQKKKLKKQLAAQAKQALQIAQTTGQAGAMQPLPGSVASGGAGGMYVPADTGGYATGIPSYAGGAGIPSGGAPGPEAEDTDWSDGEVRTGITSQAGVGGLPAPLILGGLAVGAFLLLGGGRR